MFRTVLLSRDSQFRVPVKNGFANRQSFSFTPPPTTRRPSGPGRRKRTKPSSLTIISLLAFLFLLNILQTNIPNDNRIRVTTTNMGTEVPRNLSQAIYFMNR